MWRILDYHEISDYQDDIFTVCISIVESAFDEGCLAAWQRLCGPLEERMKGMNVYIWQLLEEKDKMQVCSQPGAEVKLSFCCSLNILNYFVTYQLLMLEIL